MVTLEKIRKKYSKNVVLQDVSIQIQSGSMIGILGGNGCGKSTLLSILAGVQRADGGHFFYDVQAGKKVEFVESEKCNIKDDSLKHAKNYRNEGISVDLLNNTQKRNELVSYVPQDTPLIEELSAWDNLRMWYSASDLKLQLSDGMLKMLGIDEFIKVPVKKMSGGMKKRLSIGCAINSNPKILLLDEPTAALDLVCKQKIYDYLNYFKNQGGIILLATHEIQEIELCDELYFIKGGLLHSFDYDGNTEKLLNEFTKSQV